MPPPRFEPIVTLGNVITLISMILAVAGAFYTTRGEVDEMKRNAADIKQMIVKFDAQIAQNTNRLTALEEWKAIGPRFTASDAAVMKAATIAEAQSYTNGVASDMRSDLKEMGKKIDALTVAMNDIRVLLASQGRRSTDEDD